MKLKKGLILFMLSILVIAQFLPTMSVIAETIDESTTDGVSTEAMPEKEKVYFEDYEQDANKQSEEVEPDNNFPNYELASEELVEVDNFNTSSNDVAVRSGQTVTNHGVTLTYFANVIEETTPNKSYNVMTVVVEIPDSEYITLTRLWIHSWRYRLPGNVNPPIFNEGSINFDMASTVITDENGNDASHYFTMMNNGDLRATISNDIYGRTFTIDYYGSIETPHEHNELIVGDFLEFPSPWFRFEVGVPGIIASNAVVTDENIRFRVYRVTANYIDEERNALRAPIVFAGYTGDVYVTEEKEIEGYHLIELPSNQTGVFQRDPIEVDYIYRKDMYAIDAKDSTLYIGDVWNPEDNFVSAIDRYGNPMDFSSEMTNDTVDTQVSGVYPVTYTNGTATKTVNVTVEERKLLTVTGLKTDSWHKDELISIFKIDYYNKHVTNQVIYIPNLSKNFSNITVIAKDQDGNTVDNFPVTASGDRLQIWNYSGDLALGQLSLEVSGKVKSIEGVGISDTNYFDFGLFSATSSLGNGTFLAEAESEQSVMAKASILTVNHLCEVGEHMADSIITYEMPGVSYETTALDFEGYRVKEIVGEAVGEHTTVAPIEVTYIYEEIPGILEIQKVSHLDFEFGNVKQSSRNQAVSATGEQAPTITISDYSDATQWSLYASASPFRSETNKELKGAGITLKDLKIVESVHSWITVPSRDVLLSTTPQLMGIMANPNGIYGDEHGQTVIQIGEAKNDSLTGVSLNLPANTVMDPGAYQTTITWELVGDPTIGGSR